MLSPDAYSCHFDDEYWQRIPLYVNKREAMDELEGEAFELWVDLCWDYWFILREVRKEDRDFNYVRKVLEYSKQCRDQRFVKKHYLQ